MVWVVASAVKAVDGIEVRLIQKKWLGRTKELCTGADKFSTSFPMDMDVNMKAYSS